MAHPPSASLRNGATELRCPTDAFCRSTAEKRSRTERSLLLHRSPVRDVVFLDCGYRASRWGLPLAEPAPTMRRLSRSCRKLIIRRFAVFHAGSAGMVASLD